MKVAVSIPDPVFAEAEQLARDLRTTRSHLYARALAEFVEGHAPDRITQALDTALEGIDQDEDRPILDAARRRLVRDNDW